MQISQKRTPSGHQTAWLDTNRTPGGHQYAILDTTRTPLFIAVSANRKFTLRADRGTGKHVPVVLEVRIAGNKFRYNTGLQVAPAKWDKATQRVKPSPGAGDANVVLDSIDLRTLEIFRNYHLRGITPTISRFRDDFLARNNGGDFLSFAIGQLEAETIAPATYRKIKSSLGVLASFRERIAFADIDHEFVRAYDQYLQRVRKNGPGGRNKNLKVLNKYTARALDMGLLFDNPFRKYKIPNPRGHREALLPEQVKLFHQLYYKQGIPEIWQNILQTFLFSCFTGVRPGDYTTLRSSHIQDNQLVYMPSKTVHLRKVVKVPLSEVAKNLLNPANKIFSRIYAPQVANRELKAIARYLGINLPVTQYTARHTFASNYLHLGGSVQELREIMGHSDIKTTMVYVHIADAWKMASHSIFDEYFGRTESVNGQI